MKLTKKLEAEILKTYYDVWDAYLKGDMRTFASILDENCYIIGSAAGEVFKNKKAAVKYYKSTSEQITGKAEFRNRKIKVMPVEKGFMVNEESDLYLLIDDQWTFYGPGRISSLFHKKNNKWKVIHQHGSFPDSKTEEGEQVNTDKIKAENIQLRDAVKRRTEELEGKNRELEIEAALERVRSRTNAMHRSENLHDIINEVNDQLRQLGFRFDGTDFLTDYSDKGYNLWLANFPTPIYVPAIDHKIFHLLKNFFKRGDNFFTFTLSTEEKNIHFKNVFENTIAKNFPEELRQHVYNAKGMATSCVVLENIILSVTNFASIPYSDTENEILKRFAKVFQQSYTRFLDLQKAEAQAREARIEAALEKVRGRAMAMHKSEELLEAGALLYRELSKLGIEKLTSGYMLIDEDEKMGWNYGVNPTNGQIIPKPVGVPLTEKKEIRSIIEAWKRQEPIHVKHLDPEETIIHQSYMADHAVNFPISKEKLLSITPERLVIHTFNFKQGYLIIVRGEVLSAEQQEMVVRFAKVFEMTYRRFLDLQKAEAQAREAQVETGLERVRSKTMAMHKSEEVTGIAVSLNEELMKLGFEGGSTIIIIDKETGDTEQWSGFSEDKTLKSCNVPYFKHPCHDAILHAWKRDEKFLVYKLAGEEKKTFDEHYFATGYKDFPESDKKWMRQMGSVTFSYAFMKYGAIHWGPGHLTEEQLRILQRFAKVFEQSYTRFLDLQKAEAQVREAQIEAALERVRSRSMAMHKSDDLHEVIKVVTEQLSVLDLKFNVANFAKIDPDGSWDIWLSTPDQTYPALIHVPYLDHPLFNEIKELIAKNNDFYTGVYTREEATIFFHHFFENTIAKNTPEERKQFLYSSEGFARSIFLTKNIWFSVARYDITPFIDEENAIFKRFANVFEQAYTRFLDLQKAEAQAREAQIEASLERVRSRAMAMQNSDELRELIGTVFTELTKLDIVLTRCLIMIYDPRSNDSVWWMANSEAPTEPIGLRIQNHEHPPYAAYLKAWQEKKLNWVYVLEGAVKVDWDNFLFVETELSHLPDFVIAGMKAPERVYLNSSFNSFGNLTLATLEPLSNEHFDILLRFAKVFDLTYTRFNDLKQAEAQAKESRIQLALERVRARTMAMQKSDELAEAARLLYDEFNTLGINTFLCGYCFYKEEQNKQTVWVSAPDGTLIPDFTDFPLGGDHVLNKRYEDWKQKKPLHVLEIKGEENKEHHRFLSTVVPKKIAQEIFAQIPDRIIFYCANFSAGYLFIIATEFLTREEEEVIIRFAKVFESTYTRFLDLQKAEAQAKEAQIELALERVRARTMAMHKSEELSETAQVLFQQLSELGGIPDRIAIGIADETRSVVNFWTTDQQGSHLDHSFSARLNERTTIAKTYQAWKEQKRSLVVDLHGEELKEWIQFAREEMGIAVKDDQIKDRRVHTLAFFSHGWILITSHEPQSPDTIQILERFATVFNLTYRRFLDLQKAEAQAREAQIETALEKIRSRSLAMHKSDELQDVVNTVFERLTDLNVEIDSCNIAIFKEGTRDFDYWIASPIQKRTAVFHLPYIDFGITKDIIEAKHTGKDFFTKTYPFDEKNKWFEYSFKNTDFKYIDEQRKKFITDAPAITVAIAFSKNTGVQFNRYSLKALTEREIDILKRFSKVFEQAYIRFLDLEKAEAQAREAQIEALLERVRSRTMAMQKSDELTDVAGLLFEQVSALGIKTWTAGFNVWSEDNNSYVDYITSPQGGFIEPYTVYTETAEALTDISNARKSGVDFDVQYVEGEKIKQLYLALTKLDEKAFEIMLQDGGRFPSHQYEHFVFGSKVSLMFITYEPVPEAHDIFKRLGKVFEQTYTRFLDLQKAEAQARESQIEGALEKVRSHTMGMRSSEELANVASVMFDQMRILGGDLFSFGIVLCDKHENMVEQWHSIPGAGMMAPFFVPVNLDHIHQYRYDQWKTGTELFSIVIPEDYIAHHFELMLELPSVKAVWEGIAAQGISLPPIPTWEIDYGASFRYGYLLVSALKPFEEDKIFPRFAKVFEQAYTRFLDLQKAEVNAREAQIEAGLERVRAKAMAMHSSKDLAETLSVFYRELKSLSVVPIRCGVALMDKEPRMAELTTMNTTGEGDSIEIIGKIKMSGHPVLDGVFESWLVQKEYHAVLRGNQIKEYYQVLKPQINYLDYSHDEVQFGYYFMFNEGDVYAWTEKELTEDELTIYRRFTTVISLTYKRYKDLQQAEAQAKEAQIETGLERVRARTMAMHSSEDVSIATATMFTELEKLGIENFRGGITNIIPNRTQHVWSVNNLEEGRVLKSVGTFNIDAHPFWQLMYKEWEAKKDFIHYYLAGEDKQDYFEVVNAIQGYLPQNFQQYPDLHFQVYYFNEGAVWTNSLQPHSEEDKQVMKRFTSVFSLTYRRYQDLKKAEAQAKEATIEAALERVRGKAMAMHNSNDLSVTTSMIITELGKLGIKPIRCGVGIINKETHKGQLYTARFSPDGDSLSVVGWVLLEGHPVLENIYEKWVEGEDYFPELSGDSRKAYYEQLLAGLSVPTPDFKDEQIHYGHFFSFSVGCLYAWSEVKYNDDEIKILKRFASIIDLTFRRYFELQKSETNAREAVKQAALDRVRAEIASMRTINDLDRITPLIWNELTVLGIPFIRCGVFIMDEDQQLIHTFLSTPDGKAIAAFHLPYDTPGNLRNVVSNWKQNKNYIDHWDEAEFIQFADILVKGGALVSAEQYLKTIPKGGFYLHFLPFLQGMLYVGNTNQLKEEEIELIQHVADAFSTAYARYEDFNKLESAKQQVEKTLTDLKQAQTQLVQSEKMASLGELTAGIAHEIQNPLNFVNNFSEVSKELLDEMKTELETGNTEDAKDIADDVIQNLEKINHHGKRADAIVKSMLQHSRSSTGKKEPTDINGLADEYLRLAYHGLRAKDKSFNSKFETEFDSSIGKINIISQDIGRVLVNLINNAFYAVSERKKQESNGYEPSVTVYTKKVDDKIEIKVKDNGNGIPQKVLDKIFQPFFTTKPTGQGTGLGLSLAYDIITKGHGGELKVETKEGEGSEFVILLAI